MGGDHRTIDGHQKYVAIWEIAHLLNADDGTKSFQVAKDVELAWNENVTLFRTNAEGSVNRQLIGLLAREEERCVTIGVEFISVLYRMPVYIANIVQPGKCGNEHHQRRPGQVKIGH